MRRGWNAPVARSGSSRRWLREHARDPHVRDARARGYRGRAVAKLREIDARDRLFHPGQRVIDLGAAPGAWSQYAAERIGPNGHVVATDILPMDPIPDVTFIRGDFREAEVLAAVRDTLGGSADVVLSDMAPNMSGIDAVDQPASMLLAELAHELAIEVLGSEGVLVTKMFQGEGSETFLGALRRDFTRVKIRKPQASRPRSREVYVLAGGRKL